MSRKTTSKKKSVHIPHRVTLACYLIKVRTLYTTDQYLQLDSFVGADFLDFVGNFFNSIKSVAKNDEQKKTIQIDTQNYFLDTRTRKVSGIMLSGEYGIESRIIDTDTGAQKYHKKRNDADERPFYFLLHFPKGKNEGIMILQRTGNLGINDIMSAKLRAAFKEKYADLVLDFPSMVTKELADTFITKGGIRQVTLTKYIHASDLADKTRTKDHKEKNITMELTFKARRGSFLGIQDKVKRFIADKNTKIFSMKGMNALGFDEEYQTSIQVTHNGNTRTIDLSDTGLIRPYYDIHNDLIFEETGHPSFKSINECAGGLLEDIIAELYP